MNKFLFKLSALMMMSAALVFTSCDDDDDLEDQKVIVHFSAKPLIEGNLPAAQLKGLEV